MHRDDFDGLVRIRDYEDEGRSWHLLQLEVEKVLLGNWIRPDSLGLADAASTSGDVFF